jgi:hypothetical protein
MIVSPHEIRKSADLLASPVINSLDSWPSFILFRLPADQLAGRFALTSWSGIRKSSPGM